MAFSMAGGGPSGPQPAVVLTWASPVVAGRVYSADPAVGCEVDIKKNQLIHEVVSVLEMPSVAFVELFLKKRNGLGFGDVAAFSG